MRIDKQDEEPGFHDLDLPQVCRDTEHGAPMHLYVPAGKKYVHYCPTCGRKSVLYGSGSDWRAP